MGGKWQALRRWKIRARGLPSGTLPTSTQNCLLPIILLSPTEIHNKIQNNRWNQTSNIFILSEPLAKNFEKKCYDYQGSVLKALFKRKISPQRQGILRL